MNNHHHSKIVSVIVEHPIAMEFLRMQGLQPDVIKEEIANAKRRGDGKTSRVPLTREQCLEILGHRHDYKWIGDGSHCVILKEHGDRPHTFCGLLADVVCQDCLKQAKNQEILAKLKSGDLNPERYRIGRQEASFAIARNRYKSLDESVTSLRSKSQSSGYVFVDYRLLRDHGYCPKMGLVLKPVVVKGKNKYHTVGVDERWDGRMRPISVGEIGRWIAEPGLQDIIPTIESLDPEAQRYFLHNNIRPLN